MIGKGGGQAYRAQPTWLALPVRRITPATTLHMIPKFAGVAAAASRPCPSDEQLAAAEPTSDIRV